MTELKKKQHYVWSEYLRAWAEEDKIWTFFMRKDTNQVQKTNLINVAQENFFYKIIDLTDEEEEYLVRFIDNSHWTLKDLQMDFLNAFASTKRLRGVIKTIKSEKMEKKLKLIKANIMEDSHAWIESDGARLISCRSVEDLAFLEENDLRYKTLIYLCLQYFRTKKMKDSIEAAFKNKTHSPVPRVWNILSFIIGTNVAMNISLNPNIKYILLESRTQEKFLTSDQPVINVLGNQMDELGNVINLELYYPLSPEYALLIHFRDDQSEKYKSILIKEDVIMFYNQKIIDNANTFIFSVNRNKLDQLITKSEP